MRPKTFPIKWGGLKLPRPIKDAYDETQIHTLGVSLEVQVAAENILRGFGVKNFRNTDCGILQFRNVFMHTDGFRYTILLPLCGRGVLSAMDGNTVRYLNIHSKVGVVFNSSKPHDFELLSRSAMMAVSFDFSSARSLKGFYQ